MAEIVNLNRARKTKARVDAQIQAAQNRVTFGRAKVEKAARRAEKIKSEASLDGHKREP